MSKLIDLFNDVYYTKLRPDKTRPVNSNISSNRSKNIDYSKRLIKNQKLYNRYVRSNSTLSFRERSYDRLHSSAYIFDFASSNIRYIVMVFMLLIALSQIFTLTDNDISKLNPFESGISILQSISNAGANAKFNFENFLNSFSTITATDLEFSIFGVDVTIPPFIGRGLSVVISFISAIGGFIVFIVRVIYMIVRIFLGL